MNVITVSMSPSITDVPGLIQMPDGTWESGDLTNPIDLIIIEEISSG